MDENTLEVRTFLDRPIHPLGDLFPEGERDVPREVIIEFTDASQVIVTPEQLDALQRFLEAALNDPHFGSGDLTEV
ncbi:MAG: hypothetical protein EBZ91_06570 [Gammaproteobacteria bacterium]|nr:hypothetical protein [Gammaproteobacteria bacterium]